MRKLFLLLALAGCGGAPEEASVGLDQLGLASPTLRFERDWRVTQSGAVVAGSPVQVVYDEERLASCRSSQAGRPTWSITAYWMIDGGVVSSQAIAGLDPNGGGVAPGEITFIPAAPGELQLWFHATSAHGCSAWDSDFGRNFRFRVEPAATAVLRFARDWSETVGGTLRRGAPVLIDFDLERTPWCRQTYNGLATWEVLAELRFDGGAIIQAPVTQVSGFDRIAAPARVDVPASANELEIWFKNTDRAGCVGYDSDYGRNYRFPIRR